MKLFSQRYGHEPVKSVIQTDSIDDDLRNALWSILKMHYWDQVVPCPGMSTGFLSDQKNNPMNLLCVSLWLDYFKKPLDTLPDDWKSVVQILRNYFFGCLWYAVYDFIECVSMAYPIKRTNESFRDVCNIYLEREVSAYRFVASTITRITTDEEIAAIEDALLIDTPPVREHLNRALEKLSDRSNPDYRNSIKESISAVEALVRNVTESEKGTLGDLLTVLEQKQQLHPALKAAFSKLYGYTCNADGIRHALTEGDTVSFEQAKFMLVVCSAFANYVIGTLKAR